LLFTKAFSYLSKIANYKTSPVYNALLTRQKMGRDLVPRKLERWSYGMMKEFVRFI